jgi:hypothetical protein
MDVERFKSAWREQPVPEGLEKGEREMIEGIERRMRHFHRRILVRDLVETTAAVLVAVVLLATAWTSGHPLAWAGALAVGAAGVGVARRLQAARRTPSASAQHDLSRHLREEIDAVSRQIRLLRSVASWYVLPLMLGGFVWSLGVVLAAATEGGVAPGLLVGVAAIVVALVLGAVGWAVWRLNQWAVRHHLEPLHADLTASLRALDPDPPAPGAATL